MKALIIGATGATGRNLTWELIQDNDYTQVVIFVRRASGMSHPKLVEILTDFDNLETITENIKGDVWFSCLGTTLKTAGSKEAQKHIDYEIPLKFAEITKKNGIPTAVLLSAYGASSSSRLFYSQIKGQLEEKIDKLGFNSYIIFRPGLLLRNETDRLGERISAGFLKFVNRLGLLKKFEPIPTGLLAKKLVKASKAFKNGKHIIELEKIFKF